MVSEYVNPLNKTDEVFVVSFTSIIQQNLCTNIFSFRMYIEHRKNPGH